MFDAPPWGQPEPGWTEAGESAVRLKSRAGERRAWRRLPLELDVAVEGGTCYFATTSSDVSPGGMFVATQEQIPIGTEVLLTFSLPSGTELEVLGVVTWRRSPHDHAALGMGVSFFCLDPRVKEMLERFCAVREPLYYEDIRHSSERASARA